MVDDTIPVITIDGPSGTGKGTISRLLAKDLGFHFLDSGALYRLLGLAAHRHAIPLHEEGALQTLAGNLDIRFVYGNNREETQVLLEGELVTDAIRTEACGKYASVVAALPAVRLALLERQRAFCQPPGLVADGRDMGTVVFPQAVLKVFLSASVEERALRRYKQLKGKEIDVKLDRLLKDIEARDARDSARNVSPMAPASDAVYIDTTHLNIEDVLGRVKALWAERFAYPAG